MDERTEQLIQRLLSAAARSGGEDARRLVAEARAEAEAEVRDLLKSAIKAVLLRQAVGELELLTGVAAADSPLQTPEREPAPQPAPIPPAVAEASPAAPPAPAATFEEPVACYVYGIASADALTLPPNLTGVDGDAPVLPVRHDGLAAITSAVRLSEIEQSTLDERVKDLAWVEQKVHAHDRVVKAAAAGAAVIPCRFCTIVADADEARKLLALHRDAIRQTLDRLEGKREWGVKAIYSPDADAGGGDEEGSGAEAGGEAAGRSYLLHKRRKGLRRSESLQAAHAAADECHRVLSAASAESALLPARDRGDGGGKLVLNGAYLVADADGPAFDAALAELQSRYARQGVTLERTGPWPPYNFARLSLTLEPEPPRQAAPDERPEAAA